MAASTKFLSSSYRCFLRNSSVLRLSRNSKSNNVNQKFNRRTYYVKPKEKKGPSSKAWGAAAAITCGTLTGVVIYLGHPANEAEAKLYKSELLPLGYLYRARDRIHDYKEMFVEPSSMKLLPDPLQAPYLQPPYTLVLEMTDVLVHPEYDRKSGWRFRKRPGVEQFISQLSAPNFEIVIYTHENGFSASPVVDGLDPDGYIMYRLYRDATKYLQGTHVKDLSCLNRDLSRVIILDCNPTACKLQERNSLVIKKWEGDTSDTTLTDLIPFFHTIAMSGVDDVRPVLDFYRNEDDVVAAFNRNQEKLREQNQQATAMQQKASGNWSGILNKGWLGKTFANVEGDAQFCYDLKE